MKLIMGFLGGRTKAAKGTAQGGLRRNKHKKIERKKKRKGVTSQSRMWGSRRTRNNSTCEIVGK